MSDKRDSRLGGPIDWMVHNRVTPNLLMIFFLAGGLFMSTKIKQEVFPFFELDRVTIMVPYPGSSPTDVEQGIVLAIEDAIEGVDGIKEITDDHQNVIDFRRTTTRRTVSHRWSASFPRSPASN